MGHPRVQPGRAACLARLAGRLLASPGAVCGEAEWQATLYALETDREAFRELILDPSRNLHEPFPWGDGQTLLREALLLADHNAYHLGQIVDVRRALGCWPPGEPRLDEG